jgi:SAM-dependent methyltransferase
MKATNCRMCGSKELKQWLDLGLHPHSDHFHKEKEAEMFYPLGVSICEDCGLNQLTYIVAKEELYLKDYLYEASITKTADDHWTEFAESSVKRLNLKPGSLVIDIGSNDGSLLLKYKALGMEVLGIDPTPEATQLAIDRGVPTKQEFFGASQSPMAQLVVGTNVFAHVDNLSRFMKDLKKILPKDGVFIFESPYFGEFLKGLEYDTVYHQHLSYLSLRPLVTFLEKIGMEAFEVEQHELHGGGFRVYIARQGEYQVQASVVDMLENETWDMDTLKDFAEKTMENRNILASLIQELHAEGKSIAVVSTPAKGNTLLNYTGIGRFIDFATDKSKLKQGRYTPGTQIKVYSDDELVKRQPDYALILAWNFFPEITANIRKAGFKGRFIRPLPKVEIL